MASLSADQTIMFDAIKSNPYIRITAQHIAAGEVVAYPTEAVWGLGCDPFNEQAVLRILELKRRPVHKGVILIAGEISQVEFLLDGISSEQRQQLLDSWPGPHTWLVPHQQRVSPVIHGDFDTVAVRVSAHPVVRALCHHFGGPIVSTSANPAAMEPARTESQARVYFGDQVSYCPGVVGAAKSPSKIQDLKTGAIIRA